MAASQPADTTAPKYRLTTMAFSTMAMVSRSIANFFGVGEENPIESERWQKRRARYPTRKGLLKEGMGAAPTDDVDSSQMRYIRDPLRVGRQQSHLSSTSTYQSRGNFHKSKRTKKPSVLRMTYKGVANATSTRRKVKPNMGAQNRSFISHGDETPYSAAEFSLVDDVFFDETPAIESGEPMLDAIAEEKKSEGLETGKWVAAVSASSSPLDPRPDTYDTPDGVGLGRITKKVVDSALEKPAHRRIGMGFVGRLFHRRFRTRLSSTVKDQIDEMDDHRPYFTYWVTFVQVVIFIVSLSVYGFAMPGFTKETYIEQVMKPNLLIQSSPYSEPHNFWLGNRQADLIHLGAKYSPCMRQDLNVIRSQHDNLYLESTSGCCMLAGVLAVSKLWRNIVLDCTKPLSQRPFEWDKNFTKWPICLETPKTSKLPWMSCDVTGHPCCFGIQGECFVTTRAHCDHKRGYYHDDKFLCSQICGMIPFSSPLIPDQFYRLWTSLFLHGGFAHIVLTLAFQILIMRDLEKLAGAIRVAIIYLGSGIAGSLTSAIFLPYQVEVGPAGAQFGILACLIVEVFQSWQMLRQPWRALGIVGGITLALFLLGFLPWVDNYAHLVGFLFGVLLAFALLPYVTFGRFDRRRKIIGIVVSLVTTCGLFSILIILFYVTPIYECKGCQYFNCIPFTDDFCENHDIHINNSGSYDLVFNE